ncbi:MAG: adenylyltransferase/cytidyltransferase family protein [bacterium]|nr:adenylyltransferase/cytidyltransferase family protein [bacterium]
MSNEREEKPTKIMVFGTFDGLHLGHLHFFKQAKKISTNSFLVVSIARDKNVIKIKGHYPLLNEKKRKKLLEECVLVDKVVLGGLKNYFPHIKKENPNIIALGYDQKAYVEALKRDLKQKGLKISVKRLKPYMEKIYKNSLLKKKR